MAAAGLKGIEEKLEPPEAVEGNIYQMSEKKRAEMGIERLPESLGHALAVMEDSQYMKDALGDHVYKHFLVVKKAEWDSYRTQITQWEIENLLQVL